MERGSKMKFKSVCPELETVTFGCPYFSNHSQEWFIEWYRDSGFKTSLTRPSAKELKWILANPAKIKASQAKIETWLKKLRIK